MATTTMDVTTCDLCGYGDGYGAINDFVRHGGYDFCVWCAADEPTSSMSCGDHTVTFTEGWSAWACTCGSTYGASVLSLRMLGVPLAVMDALPNLSRATASNHVQS